MTLLGTKADPLKERIEVDGKLLNPWGPKIYILLYKPKGTISSASDPEGRPVVTELVKKATKARVYPVGRLDYDAEGVLLLTNDGELTTKLIHPKYAIEKKYLVKVRGVPTDKTLKKLRAGIRLEDGLTAPARVRFVRATKENSWIEICVTEGRNHLIKRMCTAAGHPVSKLKRLEFAGLNLRGLKISEYKVLNDREVKRLKSQTEKKVEKGRGGRVGKGRPKKEKATPAKETKELLKKYYSALFTHFGVQKWWPASSRFEVIVGAILTQNTNWGNVELAIRNLKRASLLTPEKMHGARRDKLAQEIRPAGYYNVKAGRLKNFLDHLFSSYDGKLTRLLKKEHLELREELLSINGIGEETADSILLYAAGKPAFVVDAYTKRIFSRHGVVTKDVGYRMLQRLFTDNLEKDAALFNEYHALIVMAGKEFCKTKNQLCGECPLGEFL